MRVCELIVEGPGPLDEPLRYELGAGHLVVRPDEPILAYLAAALYGEAPVGAEGGVRLEIDTGEERQRHERRFGEMEAGEALFPAGAFFHLQPRPRPPVLGEEERAALRAELPRLEAELRAQEEVERLDAELQSLQHELSGIEAKLEARENAAAAARAAAAEAAAYRAVELPADLEGRLAAHERARARQEEKERRLRRAIGEEAKRETENRLDLRRDRRLWAGIGAGGLSLLLAAFTPWKGLAVLSIPCFGVAAALLLVAISHLQRREEAGRRRAFLEEKLAEAEAERAADRRDLEVVLEATASESIEALRAWMGRAAAAEEEARRAAEALASLEAREELRDAAARREQLAAAIDAHEKKLASLAAGAFRSPGQVRAEIAAIREKLSIEGSSADDAGALVDAACRALGCDRAQLLQTVGKRASQLLSALSQEGWQKLGWGATGGVALKGSAGVSRFPALAYEEQEAVRAALAFAAAERQAAVLLVDRAFDGLGAAYQARLAKALQWLGERGVQILHRTQVAVFRRVATALEAA